MWSVKAERAGRAFLSLGRLPAKHKNTTVVAQMRRQWADTDARPSPETALSAIAPSVPTNILLEEGEGFRGR